MHTNSLQRKVREAERKYFFFIYKARLAALLVVPSHTYLFTWPRAAGCKLCFRAIERDLQEHFYRQAMTRACHGSHCFSPDRTEGHLCPAAGTQTGLRPSPSDQLLLMVHFAAGTTPRSHGRPALLYKTWVLKILKHLKQKVLFLSIF